ncbi:alpha/beta fold hydrolase [uncultured Tateyamaria sp.]|uniref:PHA/PHB synthase family protein n=1 Tax=uncultured Tateyamaria sp. TaxID=455651 RepID=UPI002638A61D|nr:alpha/beta fold hydrolase [uncultured Tateyamaria sp.]
MPKDSTDRNLDRILHSAVGKATGGLSPTALSTAWLDWALHVVGSPERQIQLAFSAWAKGAEAWTTFLTGKAPETDDPRFQSLAWNVPPYSQLRHWFSLQETWWQEATAPIVGVDPAHQRIVSFAARQIIDTMSPANFALTNPDVLDKTLAEHGQNFTQGWQNWIEDFNQLISQSPKLHPDYRVGETIAITPGDVIYQNQLIELIRYRPTTKKVHAEPILIVPAWIMKYYILDLSPRNSLVAYLRDQGFEVYIISWKNPDKGDADLSLEDYLNLGMFAAINHIVPQNDGELHAVGYCLGGTLLAAGAAAMARDHDTRLHSLSLLAAQVDFSEPGELSLFINENQVAFLEDIMATQGYLRADQMAGAFRMLRSTDLIWSRIVRHYLLGERTPMNDLMAWNADATRMPARMHSEYLRQMFLENQLAKGRFKVGGKTVALTDLRVPIFCLATETDHVSPWRSVFRLQMLTDTDVTFCLTAGGHNSGVLSEPGHRNRHYRLRKKTEGDPHTAAEAWMDQASIEDGSWWPAWLKWLADHSGSKQLAPAKKRWTKGPAPGRYVLG